MNTVSDVQRFEGARALQARGRFAEAERIYRELATSPAHREAALLGLCDLYEQGGRLAAAVETAAELARLMPDRLYYCARFADLLDRVGRTDAAVAHYEAFLRRQPDVADGHFNLALLYRKNKRYADAVASYEQALVLGVGRREEVYSNLGVLYAEMHRADDALRMYRRSLEENAKYIPVMFNLAGLLEETGDRAGASELYDRILALEPDHSESLARLVQARKMVAGDEPLLQRLRDAGAADGRDPLGREAAYFALGKALDDLGRYDEAFAAYQTANELGRRRNPPYDRGITELAFGSLSRRFTAEWVRRAASGLEATPIFICGMFRSGSTLIERILASHPSVTAGGELDFIPWLIQRHLQPFPERALAATPAELESIGTTYLQLVQSVAPGAGRVTDKRPDNFLHLGLIRAMFPRAKIVYTRRNALDNCLSVYCQQLGGNLHYATDLANTAHYYRQHERLMRHWRDVLGDAVFTVDYDELVQAPEPVVRRLLSFLELDWDARCLAFSGSEQPVRTASIWQVREELHARSSGRWRRYERHLDAARVILNQEDGTDGR